MSPLKGHPHWDYFQTIIEDLLRISRYVDIAPENYATYSIEFVRILLAIGSEIDVVAKQLCSQIEPSKNPKNIIEYREIISKARSNISKIRINSPKFGIYIIPWAEWATGTNPPWWKSYNDVKHHRDKSFSAANLGNSLFAASGLLVFLGYLYQGFFESEVIINRPFLFFDEIYSCNRVVLASLRYRLP